MLKKVAAKVAWVGRTASMVFGLTLVLALIFGVATMALAGSGVGGVFNLGQNNTVNAITRLTGTVAGPSLQIINNSTGAAATALNLQVATGKTPMKVNSATKVANLNSDRLDGKSAENLSRVAVMDTSNRTPIPAEEVTYGQPLSITAPAAGFVRVNGNVSVLNQGCTSNCSFVANVLHINNGEYSKPGVEVALPSFGNAGVDAVFPVSAGENTFELRLRRPDATSGALSGLEGVLTAEYTPYGSTGSGPLGDSGSATASEGPIDKGLPKR
jgi:hypothetical protein